MDKIEALLTELEVALLSGAHEPSEHGAGFSTTDDARFEARQILTDWLNKEFANDTGVIIVGGCDLSYEAIKRSIDVINIKEENGKVILVAGSSTPFASSVEEIISNVERLPNPEPLIIKAIPRFEEAHPAKQKRTNHERQPASFGKGKNKRRYLR